MRMEKDGIQCPKQLSQAVELVPVGRSKLYQDAAEGIISIDIFPPIYS